MSGCFSEYLRTYRESAGLTQSELASLVGVQTQTIWRCAHGELEPSLDAMKRLAEILVCTVKDLLHGPATGDWELRLLVSWTGDK